MKIEVEIEAKLLGLRAKKQERFKFLNERKKWTKGVLAGFYTAFLPTEY